MFGDRPRQQNSTKFASTRNELTCQFYTSRKTGYNINWSVKQHSGHEEQSNGQPYRSSSQVQPDIKHLNAPRMYRINQWISMATESYSEELSLGNPTRKQLRCPEHSTIKCRLWRPLGQLPSSPFARTATVDHSPNRQRQTGRRRIHMYIRREKW